MTWLEWFWGTLERPIKIGDQTLAFSWLSIILEWIVPVIVGVLVLVYLGRVLNKRIAAMEGSDERKHRFSGWLKVGSRLLLVAFIILLSVRFMEDSILSFFQDFFLMLGTPFYKSGSTQISVMTLILAIPVVFFSNLGGRAARAALERSKMFAHTLSESRRRTIANLLRYGVMVIALLLGLSIIGLDLTAIMILLGVFGIGIGFGLQHILASFFAGLTIVINRPFKEGDFVRLEVQGVTREGTVKAIRMINSLVLTNDGETLILPNAQLMSSGMVNLSFMDHHYAFSLSVTVDQQEDLDKVRQLLVELAKACPLLSQEEEPFVRVESVIDGGLELCLGVSLQAPSDRNAVRAWLFEEIIRLFRKQQIRYKKMV